MFEPAISLLLLIIVATLFVGLGLVLEWRGKSRGNRLLLRVLAFLGLSLGLIAIVLKPAVKTQLPGQGFVVRTLLSPAVH